MTDHPAPDAKWLAGGGHHALDPFVALSFAAAATTRLRVQTHILVLPYRNPLLTAKSVLSLDVLSGGRVILGVAPGYLKPEFARAGRRLRRAQRAHRRGDRRDAARLDRRRDRDRRAATSAPAARRCGRRRCSSPHPPIWIGGNSTAAIRRAAERGQGWVPFPNPGGLTLARAHARSSRASTSSRAGVRILREHAEPIGRTEPIDICFSPFADGAAATLDELRALEELGVTWAVLHIPTVTTRAGVDRRGASISATT